MERPPCATTIKPQAQRPPTASPVPDANAVAALGTCGGRGRAGPCSVDARRAMTGPAPLLDALVQPAVPGPLTRNTAVATGAAAALAAPEPRRTPPVPRPAQPRTPRERLTPGPDGLDGWVSARVALRTLRQPSQATPARRSAMARLPGLRVPAVDAARAQSTTPAQEAVPG